MFQLFTNDNIEQKKISIYYDYNDTPIHLNQCEKNVALNGFIKMPFINSNSVKRPNLWTNKNNYKILNLYIFKNIHNINNLEYDGELIIEHVPITNNVDKVFVVFMLKTDSSGEGYSNNIICELIENAGIKPDSINLNLNEIILELNIGEESINCMNNKNVYVFSNPIHVTSSFQSFKNFKEGEIDFLFLKNQKYDLNTMAIARNPIIENLEPKKDMVISCTPIHTSDVDKDVNFVPITSDMNKGYTLFASFFALLIILIFALYPIIQINKYIRSKLIKSEYIAFLLSYVVFTTCIASFLFSGNNYIANIIGIVIICFTLLIIVVINTLNYLSPIEYSQDSDFSFEKYIINNFTGNATFSFAFQAVVILVLFLMIGLFLYFFNKSVGNINYITYLLVLIIICISLTLFITISIKIGK